MIFPIIVLVFLGSSVAQDASAGAGWTKINKGIEVCVQPRQNGYGHLSYLEDSKLVGALKLKYHSGEVRCKSNEVYNSRWGCGTSKDHRLNIIITDESNYVIFPLPKYFTQTQGMWYNMPLVDPESSDELVFANFADPLYLKKNDRLRFWYGEDLTDNGEDDNQGNVCFDVYALFI